MIDILVPYRDRENHLIEFVPNIKKYIPDCRICIGEQVDHKPFNRGKLINIMFKELNPKFFVAHDIDMLPIEVDYSPNPGVTQLAGSKIQLKDYLGGVTMFDAETFKKVGGYHNDYFHRAEDNELRFNLHRLKIPVLELHGQFKTLHHTRKAPEFIAALWYKAQEPRKVQDQLSVCRYDVLNLDFYNDYKGNAYTHMKVNI